MDTKKCFKCGRVLPLDQFYKNKGMSDGHLNKCIECTKKDEHERYLKKSQDEAWMELERARGREKYERLGYKTAPWNHKVRKINKLEANTSRDLKKFGAATEGKEAHHWNYNNPKSIFLLSKKAHRRIHQYMVVNYEDKYCYTKDGEKLDTVEKATEYFKSILDKFGIDEELKHIDYN